MPSSNPTIIPDIINIIRELRPSKVLDLGIGKGKYGFLIKEYLGNDVENLIIDGVEGYPKNISELQEKIYNKIFIEDIRNTKSYLFEKYDITLIIDVFEHLSKEDALRLIQELIEKAEYILIAIPRYVSNQKGYDDDPKEYEKHRYFWRPNELKKYFKCFFIHNNTSEYIFIIYKDQLPNNVRRMSIRQLLKNTIPPIINHIHRHLNFLKNRKNYI